MNLYSVTIRCDLLGRMTYHVSAKDATQALKGAKKRLEKDRKGLTPKNAEFAVTTLELVEEDWQ